MFHDNTPTEGYPAGWRRYGENVGSGTADAQTIFNAFLNSAPHKANIHGDYTHIGVGYNGKLCVRAVESSHFVDFWRGQVVSGP